MDDNRIDYIILAEINKLDSPNIGVRAVVSGRAVLDCNFGILVRRVNRIVNSLIYIAVIKALATVVYIVLEWSFIDIFRNSIRNKTG